MGSGDLPKILFGTISKKLSYEKKNKCAKFYGLFYENLLLTKKNTVG
jgi:hypothetical protein